jgi:hypothetical protein
MNKGHGHVFPRPDGVKARCGGPSICHVCAIDLGRKRAQESVAAADHLPSKKLVDGVIGCSDHGCVFGHPGGMGTNGGCHCLSDLRPPDLRRRVTKNVRVLRAELDRLQRENDSLAHDCNDKDITIERLRTTLTGISTCSTCEACRGAALRALGGEAPAARKPDKFDLAFEIMRQLDAENMETMQSCQFGYVMRVTRERAAQPPGAG